MKIGSVVLSYAAVMYLRKWQFRGFVGERLGVLAVAFAEKP
jgi:hypothetical protein